LDRSFQAVQLLRNKHFQGLWPCWRREGSLDEHTVLIRDIPEPIIKSSYTIWHWDIGSLASLRQSMPHTWHNVLLAEVLNQCPLASSSRDIVVDRAGVRPLAAYSIMMSRLVTFSHDTMKLFRIVRSSKWENILSCKGSNLCSMNYNILPRRDQWALANLLSQQNTGKNQSIMTKCMKSAE
jgi:hypothetical protein